MKKFKLHTATTKINEIWSLPRILTQDLSSSLEAEVLTWLYVKLYVKHNCDTDSILSVDRLIPKGTRGNPLSINGQKVKLCTRYRASCAIRTLESYNAGVGREGLIWVWIVSGVGDLYPKI